MTKYIVSGYIGFDNFGDEAIQKVLTSKLKEQGAESITLISSNPEKTCKLYGVNSCGMFQFIKPLINADVLISGGGSLLQDVTSLKSLLYYLGVIYTAYLFNKKVEIFAQGIGPIKSKLGIFLTKFCLKHAHKISVRDKNSQLLLESWRIKSELVNDPILDLDLAHKNIKGTVGIQLRKFDGIDEKFLYNLAKTIKKYFPDKKIKIISLQDSIDFAICNRFKEILEELEFSEIELKSHLDAENVIEEISNLEYLIAMRFHANVIGIKSGVKTLGINYDPKVENLTKDYNLPIIALNSDNFDIQFEKLTEK